MKTALNVFIVILLVVFPYSTVLTYFSPYLSAHSFQNFVLASVGYGLVFLALAFILSGKRQFKNGALIYVAIGAVIAPPLMLGPPEYTNLLQRVTEEHFRYGLLIFSVILFFLGSLLILKNLPKNTFLYALLGIITVLGLWDNISSYRFNLAMEDWIESGKKSKDFLLNYDFNELFRTGGRTLLYVFAIVLSYILYKKQQVKKWVWVSLSLFSVLGIVFYFLFNFVSVNFYFPFMIPAIAFAPIYWLGIALLFPEKPERE